MARDMEVTPAVKQQIILCSFGNFLGRDVACPGRITFSVHFVPPIPVPGGPFFNPVISEHMCMRMRPNCDQYA